jgi:hypothetical protein
MIYPVTGGCQHRGNIDVAVYVVGPAVQQNDRGAMGRAGLGVSHVQKAGIDMSQRAERRVCSSVYRSGRLVCASPEPSTPTSAAAIATAALSKKRRRS